MRRAQLARPALAPLRARGGRVDLAGPGTGPADVLLRSRRIRTTAGSTAASPSAPATARRCSRRRRASSRFAGSVPTNGKTMTIETPSGLAVSLTHLGSIGVARNASVDEGAAVGTVGPSGTPEFDVPYVHLGIREAANDQGYLDPLAFLPVLAPPAAAPRLHRLRLRPTRAGAGGRRSPSPSTRPPCRFRRRRLRRPAAVAAPLRASGASRGALGAGRAGNSGRRVARAGPDACRSSRRCRTSRAAPAPALSPAPVATGSPHALPVASHRATPVAGRRAPAPVASPAFASVRRRRDSRSIAGSSPVVSPLLGALVIPDLGHSSAASLVPRPLRCGAAALRLSKASAELGAVACAARPGSLAPRCGLGCLCLLAPPAPAGAPRAASCRCLGNPRAARSMTPFLSWSCALLSHDSDLLRQLDAAHRSRVHDGDGRHARPLPPAARGGDVLPHRRRRARDEGLARRAGARARAAGVRRPHRGAVARAPAASERLGRLLHPHERRGAQGLRPRVPAADLRQRRHLPGRLRRLLLRRLRGVQVRGGADGGRALPDPSDEARVDRGEELLLPALRLSGQAARALRRAARTSCCPASGSTRRARSSPAASGLQHLARRASRGASRCRGTRARSHMSGRTRSSTT